MKKVTMKEFRWVGKPQRWVKSYKELSLTVEGKLCLPDGPLMLAVSDEDFTLKMTTTVAPQGGFCGVCLYHTEGSYTAVGRSKTHILVESSIHTYKTTAQTSLPTGEESVQWILKRKGALVRIGYAQPQTEEEIWFCTTTVPAMEGSVSFGPFFSNLNDASYEAKVHSIHYRKEASQERHPLV